METSPPPTVHFDWLFVIQALRYKRDGQRYCQYKESESISITITSLHILGLVRPALPRHFNFFSYSGSTRHTMLIVLFSNLCTASSVFILLTSLLLFPL